MAVDKLPGNKSPFHDGPSHRFALCGAAAHGTIIFAETFDDLNPGQVSGQGGWQGAGDAENWDVVAGGLDGAGGYIPGGTQRIQIGAGNNDRGDGHLYHNFGAQTGDVLYARITFQNPNESGTSQFFMFGLSSDGSDDFNALSGVYASNQIRARVYDDNSNVETTNSHTNLGISDVNEFRATLFTFVVKAEKTTSGAGEDWDRVTVFVNPDLSEGSAENDGLGTVIRAGDSNTASLSSFFFRTGGSSPANDEDWNVDSIAVGTTWEAIASPSPPPTRL